VLEHFLDCQGVVDGEDHFEQWVIGGQGTCRLRLEQRVVDVLPVDVSFRVQEVLEEVVEVP
jgi:hypothetical protein